jgi:hypothetical protein
MISDSEACYDTFVERSSAELQCITSSLSKFNVARHQFCLLLLVLAHQSITTSQQCIIIFRCARRSAAIAQRIQRNSLIVVHARRPTSSQAAKPLPMKAVYLVNGVIGTFVSGVLAIGAYAYVSTKMFAPGPAEVVANADSFLSLGKPAHEALLQVLMAFLSIVLDCHSFLIEYCFQTDALHAALFLLLQRLQICNQLQVNELLQAQYINYVPAAIKAGLIPMLSTMLASDDLSAASRQAVFRCLRLVTDTSFGIRTVLENPEISHTIVEKATAIMADWSATKGHPLHGKFIGATAIENLKTAAAAKELTDALYVLNSMHKAGM